MSENLEKQKMDALIYESLMEQITTLHSRLEQVESGTRTIQAAVPAVTPRLKKYDEELARLEALVLHVNERAANMRFDRQFKIGLERTKKRLIRPRKVKPAKAVKRAPTEVELIMSPKADILVICPIYPGGARAYGGSFIEKRALGYKNAGYSVTVVEVNAGTRQLQSHDVNGIPVIRLNPAGLQKLLRQCDVKQIAAHQVEEPIWQALKKHTHQYPTTVWVHGFEARNWENLAFNFTESELKTLRPRLENANITRKRVMNEIFSDDNVHVVFVSKFMRAIAEDFAGTRSKISFVIPNLISEEDFPYVEKAPEDRKKILWVRTFAAKNYSNDISRKFIEDLSQKPFFEDLTISIFGDGKFFEQETESLRRFKNIKIEQRFLSPDELRTEHAKHGVMLVPSRWDSQGLTNGEAMSSGLVTLTNSVAAIPEFADESCAIMARVNDHKGLVDGFEKMIHDPNLFMKLSQRASERSQGQCGHDATLKREISLLKWQLNR